jgi:excisionase family DNA binding protein
MFKPIHTDEMQRERLRKLEMLLRAGGSQPTITIQKNGEQIEAPESLSTLIQEVVPYLAEGKSISVISDDTMLTTQEAAELLGMSRPYIVSLAERGIIPFTKVGTHRRFTLADILAYKKELKRREQKLEEIARLSEEMDLYDEQ